MDRLSVFRALSDQNRLRAVLVLRAAELTVSELRAVLQLAQSTVSTLLRGLMDVDLVSVRREGRLAFYSAVPSQLVAGMLRGLTLQAVDRDSLDAVLQRRNGDGELGLASGFDTAEVAGRSWQSLARGVLAIAELGVVADFGVGSGHLSLLLAESADRLYAVDHDVALLVSLEQRAQMRGLDVRPIQADLAEASLPEVVDVAVLSLVLCSAADPTRVINQAASCLKPGGKLWVTALANHEHESIRARLGHHRAGISVEELKSWATLAGFKNIRVMSGGRERRSPRLESLVMVAVKAGEER